MARRLSYEDLVAEAMFRSTKAQREKLKQYLGANWRVTKVDGLVGYDCIVCICNQNTVATIDPMGVVTRPGPKLKTVSYKFPKTNIAAEERRAAQ